MLNLPILGNILDGNEPDHIFFGVNNTAKLIKKIYLGVKNKAQLLIDWVLSYSSISRFTLQNMDLVKSVRYATPFNNLALISGGNDTGSETLTYDSNLTKTIRTPLGQSSGGITSVDNYALSNYSYSVYNSSTQKYTGYSEMTACNNSFTISHPTSMATVRRNYTAGCNSNYAIFAGGYLTTGNMYNNSQSTVEGYNTSLSRSNLTALSQVKSDIGDSVTLGQYCLILGGQAYSGSWVYSFAIEAYNQYGTKSTVSNASSFWKSGCTVFNGYALLGGGYTGSADTNTLYKINTSLTVSSGTLTYICQPAATTIGSSYAIFAGGSHTVQASNPTVYNNNFAEAFDTNFTAHVPHELTVVGASERPLAIGVGNYGLFMRRSLGSAAEQKSITAKAVEVYSNVGAYETYSHTVYPFHTTVMKYR